MKKRITEILKILSQKYPKPTPPLKHRNAFELLIAVILSAQCTDERVNKITPFLFPTKRACEAQDILDLGEENLKKIIKPCGYFNQKSRAIMDCAQKCKKIGELPSDFETLRQMRGVGSKTAQVIQSQWFNIPALPVDTHIHRVANRLALVKTGKNRDKTERGLKTQIDKTHWSDFHLQVIYFGRETCTARKPKCPTCPLAKLCKWPGKNMNI